MSEKARSLLSKIAEKKPDDVLVVLDGDTAEGKEDEKDIKKSKGTVPVEAAEN